MSVLLVLITVTLMLPVPTLLVASPVPVTRDTLEMESHVRVSGTVSEQLTYITLMSSQLRTHQHFKFYSKQSQGGGNPLFEMGWEPLFEMGGGGVHHCMAL
jgi:hypothetical protein